MAETSFNAVRKGIITKLKQLYPDVEIYGEAIPQGFQEPSFFVKMFPSSETKIMDNRYKRYQTFDVHYFTDAPYVNDDLHEMAERLYNQLETITVNGDELLGTKMEHEIVDGVLHFNVSFNIFVYKPVPKNPFMEELTIKR